MRVVNVLGRTVATFDHLVHDSWIYFALIMISDLLWASQT